MLLSEHSNAAQLFQYCFTTRQALSLHTHITLNNIMMKHKICPPFPITIPDHDPRFFQKMSQRVLGAVM